MVSGRLIKRLGQVTISAAENTRIRFRLLSIRNTIRTKPQGYWTLSNPEVQVIVDDLCDLARYASFMIRSHLTLSGTVIQSPYFKLVFQLYNS